MLVDEKPIDYCAHLYTLKAKQKPSNPFPLRGSVVNPVPEVKKMKGLWTYENLHLRFGKAHQPLQEFHESRA